MSQYVKSRNTLVVQTDVLFCVYYKFSIENFLYFRDNWFPFSSDIIFIDFKNWSLISLIQLIYFHVIR